ncbi:MAG: T9SS type A sorting domain-containing protein [Bacteroidetes bacterium]|nr:T9SS type A sorting domain-containing protein [Bacteroidota bacterium]
MTKAEHQLLSTDLFDLVGQKIANEKGVFSNPLQYDLQKYKSGIYFLQLHFENGEQVVRVALK